MTNCFYLCHKTCLGCGVVFVCLFEAEESTNRLEDLKTEALLTVCSTIKFEVLHQTLILRAQTFKKLKITTKKSAPTPHQKRSDSPSWYLARSVHFDTMF